MSRIPIGLLSGNPQLRRKPWLPHQAEHQACVRAKGVQGRGEGNLHMSSVILPLAIQRSARWLMKLKRPQENQGHPVALSATRADTE